MCKGYFILSPFLPTKTGLTATFHPPVTRFYSQMKKEDLSVMTNSCD